MYMLYILHVHVDVYYILCNKMTLTRDIMIAVVAFTALFIGGLYGTFYLTLESAYGISVLCNQHTPAKALRLHGVTVPAVSLAVDLHVSAEKTNLGSQVKSTTIANVLLGNSLK